MQTQRTNPLSLLTSQASLHHKKIGKKHLITVQKTNNRLSKQSYRGVEIVGKFPERFLRNTMFPSFGRTNRKSVSALVHLNK